MGFMAIYFSTFLQFVPHFLSSDEIVAGLLGCSNGVLVGFRLEVGGSFPSLCRCH